MQNYIDNQYNSSDPLDYLVLCNLDDLEVLDYSDTDELTEKLGDDSGSDSKISIDADDLKEWFEELLLNESENMTVEQKSISTSTITFSESSLKDKHQGETLKVNYFEEKLDTMVEKNQITSKVQSAKGIWCTIKSNLNRINKDTTGQSHHVESKHEVINCDSVNEQLELLGNNLERSMQKKQLTYDQFLNDKNEPQQDPAMGSIGKKSETTMQRTQMTSELFFEKQKAQNLSMGYALLNKVTDLANGRRQYLTAALEESKKYMASFNFAHRFNRGKRKSLSEKIIGSQNRLKILRSQSGILTREKIVTKKRRSLNELENPSPSPSPSLSKLAIPKSNFAQTA